MYVVQTFTPANTRGKRFDVKRGHITHAVGNKQVPTEFPDMKSASIAAARVEGGTAILPVSERSGHGTLAR